jgi:hypothetical protein
MAPEATAFAAAGELALAGTNGLALTTAASTPLPDGTKGLAPMLAAAVGLLRPGGGAADTNVEAVTPRPGGELGADIVSVDCAIGWRPSPPPPTA